MGESTFGVRGEESIGWHWRALGRIKGSVPVMLYLSSLLPKSIGKFALVLARHFCVIVKEAMKPPVDVSSQRYITTLVSRRNR